MTQDDQWARIEEHYRSGKPLAGRVIEASRERLIIDVGGIRGIIDMPVFAYWTTDAEVVKGLSRQELFERALANMEGKEMLLKVVEVDHERNHLVLTQKLYSEQEREARQQRAEGLAQELRPGDICRGTVVALMRSAIRLDIEGLMGFVHRGHLSEQRVNDPREVVQLGQEIEVMVLDIDGGSRNFSLVHAQMRDNVLKNMHSGQTLTGYIISLSSEGICVDLGGPIGFIPTEQVVSGYITHPADLFRKGQSVVVRIESIGDDKRVMLSFVEAL